MPLIDPPSQLEQNHCYALNAPVARLAVKIVLYNLSVWQPTHKKGLI